MTEFLQREPAPKARLADLLREIDDAAGVLPGHALERVRWLVGERVRHRPRRLVLALGYRGGGDSTDWLFLRCELPPAMEGGRRWAGRADRLRVESYEAARADPAAMTRRTAHTAAGLPNRSALVLGAGSIGSSVALLLAASGVPALRISDSDRMRPGNAVRHRAGLRRVGIPKAWAAEREVLQQAPDCAVATDPTLWDVGRLAAAIEAADVVVDATATPAFSLLVNHLAVRAGKPAVSVAAYQRAAVGRVLVVRPGTDACLVCHEGGDGGYVAQPAYPRIPPGDEGGFVEGGCGVPTVGASAVDTEAVANAAARRAAHPAMQAQGRESLPGGQRRAG